MPCTGDAGGARAVARVKDVQKNAAHAEADDPHNTGQVFPTCWCSMPAPSRHVVTDLRDLTSPGAG